MQHKFAEIIRMHPVGVLLGIDQIDDGVLVDSPWQGQLHDISGTGGIRIELADCIDDLIERRILRQLALPMEFTPISAQSACLPATYFTEPGLIRPKWYPTQVGFPRLQQFHAFGGPPGPRATFFAINRSHVVHFLAKSLVVLAFASIVSYLGFSRKSRMCYMRWTRPKRRTTKRKAIDMRSPASIFPHRFTAGSCCTVLGTAPAGASSDDQPTAPDTPKEQTTPINVVASVNQWGALAEQIGGVRQSHLDSVLCQQRRPLMFRN